HVREAVGGGELRSQRDATSTPRTGQSQGRRRHEIGLALRALLSGGLATLTDGLTYNAVLFLPGRHYAIAAFLGALVGAATNFLISRYWVFSRAGASEKPIASQAV